MHYNLNKLINGRPFTILLGYNNRMLIKYACEDCLKKKGMMALRAYTELYYDICHICKKKKFVTDTRNYGYRKKPARSKK